MRPRYGITHRQTPTLGHAEQVQGVKRQGVCDSVQVVKLQIQVGGRIGSPKPAPIETDDVKSLTEAGHLRYKHALVQGPSMHEQQRETFTFMPEEQSSSIDIDPHGSVSCQGSSSDQSW